MTDSDVFKVCPSCETEWKDREEFLSDPQVELMGYQAIMVDLKAGVFMFFHRKEGCETSMGLEVSRFTDLHDGPVFEENLCGDEECPGHCLNERSLEPCPLHCECSYVRSVLQVLRSWPKKAPEQAGT